MDKKHFIIVTNRVKDPDFSITDQIASYLEKAGCSCSVHAGELSAGQWEEILGQEAAETDGILVLGGDGTLLRTARDTVDSRIPVLGINLGTLGYLAEVEQSNLKPALQRLVQGAYHVERRMMLSGQVLREGQILEDTCALNDITITRNGRLQMLYFLIYVNGRLLKEYHADGIILATPTGSTGYNMSAGGPIVEPGAEMILLTPICAHTLQTRSVILRPEDEIVIRIREREGRENQPVEVCFDGGRNLPLLPGDEVRITKSEKSASLIRLSEASFLDVLHQKLSD